MGNSSSISPEGSFDERDDANNRQHNPNSPPSHYYRTEFSSPTPPNGDPRHGTSQYQRQSAGRLETMPQQRPARPGTVQRANRSHGGDLDTDVGEKSTPIHHGRRQHEQESGAAGHNSNINITRKQQSMTADDQKGRDRKSSDKRSSLQSCSRPSTTNQPSTPDWKGPLGHILMPRDAAKLLGRGEVRRVLRSFRRMVALSNPHNFSNNVYTQTSNGPSYAQRLTREERLLRNGIFCYEDQLVGATSSSAYTGGTPGGLIGSPSPSMGSSAAATEYIFLQQETPQERRELDFLLTWFFPLAENDVKGTGLLSRLENESAATASTVSETDASSSSTMSYAQYHAQNHTTTNPGRRSVINVSQSGGKADGFPPDPVDLWMDFLSFRTMSVPMHANIPPGVVECLFTSMSTNVNTTSPYVNGSSQPGPSRSVVRVVDYVVFLAIWYHGTVEQQSHLAFRIYQSVHQLRGAQPVLFRPNEGYVPFVAPALEPTTSRIVRDTIARFIFNIYGNDKLNSEETNNLLAEMLQVEDSHKDESVAGTALKPGARVTDEDDNGDTSDSVTDTTVPATTSTPVSRLQESPKKLALRQVKDLSVSQFVASVGRTIPSRDFSFDKQKPRQQHLLLEWLETLTKQLFPIPYCTPPSVRILEEGNARPCRALQLLCAQHGLTPLMVLECKRKFYSLIQLQQEAAAQAENQVASQRSRNDLDTDSSSIGPQNDTGVSSNGANKTVEDLVDEEGEQLDELDLADGDMMGPEGHAQHKQKHITASTFLQAVHGEFKVSDVSTVHSLANDVPGDAASSGNAGTESATAATLHNPMLGGFLSHTLALWTLRAGCHCAGPGHRRIRNGMSSEIRGSSAENGLRSNRHSRRSLRNSMHNHSSASMRSLSSSATSTCYWTLYDIVAFSCAAVRSSSALLDRGALDARNHDSLDDDCAVPPDGPLLQFLFRMFLLSGNDEDGDYTMKKALNERSDSASKPTLSFFLMKWDEECDRDSNSTTVSAKVKRHPPEESYHPPSSSPGDNQSSKKNNESLSFVQVGNMILSLLDLYHYRRHVDLNPIEVVQHKVRTFKSQSWSYPSGMRAIAETESQEHVWISCAGAIALGFIPPDFECPDSSKRAAKSLVNQAEEMDEELVSLRSVTAYVLASAAEASRKSKMHDVEASVENLSSNPASTAMSLEQFSAWHRASNDQRGLNRQPQHDSKVSKDGKIAKVPSNKRRLGLLMHELRLVASVIFGIKPSTPYQERELIRELFRRHKVGHPTTRGMQRGPEGTQWFLLHSNWMNQWSAYSAPPPDKSRLAAHQRDIPEWGFSGSPPQTTFADSGIIERPATGEDFVTGSPHRAFPPFDPPPPPPPAPSPPPIDNHVLLRQGTLVLKQGLKFQHDFLLVPPLVWSALQAWHDGGPSIERKVVRSAYDADAASSQVPGGAECEIELYPYCLTVALADVTTGGQPRPFQQRQLVSRVEPMRQLHESLCQSLNITPSQARLWKLATPQSYHREDRLLDLNLSLQTQCDRRVEEEAVLMIELYCEESQSWPRDGGNGARGGGSSLGKLVRRRNSKSNTAGPSGELSSAGASLGGEPGAPEAQGNGIVGLYNMGNTCYLNSSMQCLSHTPLLKEYFTSKSYLNDINTTNPLGQQGRLAQMFATLLLSLWKPGPPGMALTPKTFKDAIGKFNDHFAGNEQHDAQELLAFLLSGLSEDLNRIVDKPYIEQPDSDGRPDKELADIWWKNHLRREMSIIVALFTGQYKSCLTCNTCHYSSARFEPFAFLQLPLPEDDLIPVTLIYFPIDPKKPVLKYSVRVNKDGLINDALVTLSKILYHDEIALLRGKSSISAAALSSNGNLAKLGTSTTTSETQLKRLAKRRLLRLKEHEILEEDYDKDEELFLRQVASNLAVVDMRECRIQSITPSSRALSQLRESDILCTFELDPVPTETKYIQERKLDEDQLDDEEADNDENDDANNEGKTKPASIQSHKEEIEVKKTDENKEEEKAELDATDSPASTKLIPVQVKLRPDYIALVQRRLEPLPRPFLHEFTMRVFGTPLLMRIMLRQLTAPQLYDLIAERIHRLVPGLVDVPFVKRKAPQYVAPKEKEKNTNLPFEPLRPQRVRKTTMEMEQVVGGEVIPRYGFRLRLTSRDGKRCSRCPWYECCIGCEVIDMEFPSRDVQREGNGDDDDQEIDNDDQIIEDGDTLAIDWHLSSNAVSPIATNSSDGTSAHLNSSNMSAHREQSLIIGRVERHKSCQFEGKDITLEECLENFTKEEEIPDAKCSKCNEVRPSVKHMNLWRVPPILIIHLKRFQFTQHFRRKLRNMVVFPTDGLDVSHIIASDDEEVRDGIEPNGDKSFQSVNGDVALTPDQSSSNANGEGNIEAGANMAAEGGGGVSELRDEGKWVGHSDGRSETLYDLYGVVHHLGALTGGHYVASIRTTTDNRWKLFNDAQVTELTSRDIVDASAYILFYVRRDVKHAQLSDLWDVTERVGEGLTEEQIDKLVRQRERCVIS